MSKSILEIAELEVRVETLSRRNAELEAALKRETARADNANAGMHLAIAAARSGMRPSDIGVAVAMASEAGQWKADKSGKLVRYGADGLPELIGDEDMTPQGAIDILRVDANAKHLWPEDTQGDYRAPQQAPAAPQGQKAAAYTGPNPWAKGSSNLTMRVAISERDPALAERLKADAAKANQAASHGVRTGIPASRHHR